MSLNTLNAISPIDGRYRSKCESLANYFSEESLMKYRVLVEIEYYISLCELPLPQLKDVSQASFSQLRSIYENFTTADAIAIKEIEKTTNHDVKAVEYFIKNKMDAMGIGEGEQKEFVHFGLTSQDINNTAIPRSIKDAMEEVYYPTLNKIIIQLDRFSQEWKDISMLAKTHGQPASPTKLGKEIKVFSERLKIQVARLKTVPYSAKFGGATGNFNAHHLAFPEFNWVDFSNTFLSEKLKIDRSQTTTQIEHYDNMAAMFDGMKRINTILIDFSRDLWTYISMEYFKQKIKAGEVGSSAMPHKVNPIDFENAEGNLGMANAIFEHLAGKLPISRLQRDLTDSTVLRNVGVPFGHVLIAFASLEKGMSKLLLNEAAFEADLEKNWAVVAEAIQTVLRREGYPQPYEALKALTRTNEGITSQSIKVFIDELSIDDLLKEDLKKITPHNYTGVNLV
jgi:adenylosuccinate lyase